MNIDQVEWPFFTGTFAILFFPSMNCKSVNSAVKHFNLVNQFFIYSSSVPACNHVIVFKRGSG